MQIQHILALYDYSYWATARILDSAQGVTAEQFVAPARIPFPFDSLRGTLVHTLDTEQNARVRFQGDARPESLRDEDFATPAAVAALWNEEERRMRDFLSQLGDEDLHRPFDLGTRGSLPVWELLVHFANHSTQHRSEAAILLTHYGHSPGDLDYFLYAITR